MFVTLNNLFRRSCAALLLHCACTAELSRHPRAFVGVSLRPWLFVPATIVLCCRYSNMSGRQQLVGYFFIVRLSLLRTLSSHETSSLRVTPCR